MGVIKKIRQKIFNGTDWDTLYPETSAQQVITTDGGNLETKVGKCGTIKTISGAECYHISGKLWLVSASLVTEVTSGSGVGFTYNIPTALKCIKVIGKADMISSSDDLSASEITVGYVSDATPPNVNNRIIGACYDMTPGKGTRIKIKFYMLSDL